jgi:hypothetical protein
VLPRRAARQLTCSRASVSSHIVKLIAVFALSIPGRLDTFVQVPIANRAAIHFKLIVVSRRDRAQAPTPLHWFGFIGHEAIGLDLPCGLATGLGEGGEETFAVRVVAENFLAAIPAIDNVIDRTGIFEAHWARHDEKRVSTSKTVNSEN